MVIFYQSISIAVECFISGAIVLVLNVHLDASPGSKGLV